MRVVLDTNILISAFVFPAGPPEMVFRAALEDRITLVTSPAQLADAIVSGDRHLLRLGTWQNVPVMKAALFVDAP